MASIWERITNSTGKDDPILWDIFKDRTRPYRQGLVGLGGAGTNLGRRLAGMEGLGSDYLQRGNQGVGDWDFLLDDEEIQALQKDPWGEAGKSAVNVATQALEAYMAPFVWAKTAGMNFIPRVASRGASFVPTNLAQTWAMNEPEKGDDLEGSMAGTVIGSFLGPIAGEGLGAGARKLNEMGDSMFGTGRFLERLSKGVRTDPTPYGRESSEQAFTNAERIISEYDQNPGFLRKIFGIGAGQGSEVSSDINKKLGSLIESKGDVSVPIGRIKSSVVDDLMKLYQYSQSEAEDMVDGYLNKALKAVGGEVVDGQVSVPVLADLKRYFQPFAREFAGGAQRKGLEALNALHDYTYEPLKEVLGGAGEKLYGDLSGLWPVVTPMLKSVDEGTMGTQYVKGMKIPFITQAVNTVGGLLGRGIEGAGKAAQLGGRLGGNLAEGLGQYAPIIGGSLGRGLGTGSQPETLESFQGEASFGQEMSPVGQTGGGMIEGALGGGQSGVMPQTSMIQAALTERGFGGPEQASSPQIDMEDLVMQLMQGISSGAISGSDAQTILGLAQMMGQQQQQYSEDYKPKSMLEAIDYLGRRYPDMTDATRTSLAKELMGQQVDLNEDAVSGLRVLNRIETLVGNLGLKEGWLGAQLGAPGLSVGAASGANEEAKLYQEVKRAFLTTLSRASGERGVLTDADIQRIGEALPDFNDTKELANQKMAEVRGLLYDRLGISEAEARQLLGEEVPQTNLGLGGISSDYNAWRE